MQTRHPNGFRFAFVRTNPLYRTRCRSRPIATREALVSTDIGWLQEQHQRPGLQAIAKITRIRESAGKSSTETAYYLFSSHISVECANDAVRNSFGRHKPLAMVPRSGHG